jgi:hypothetical protein
LKKIKIYGGRNALQMDGKICFKQLNLSERDEEKKSRKESEGKKKGISGFEEVEKVVKLLLK